MACNTDIKDYIRNRLTFPGVSLELDDVTLDAAIMAATGWFQSHIGQEGQFIIDNMMPSTAYSVPEDCYYVTDVIFTENRTDHYTGFDFADVQLSPPGFAGYGSSLGYMGNYSDFLSLLQYRKMGLRILSSDTDWTFDRITMKLYFSPNSGPGGKVLYRYMKSVLDLNKLNPYEYWIFREYSMAQAMLTLGFGRSKYASLPGSEGDVSLNGDALIGQAEMMRADCEEKIKTMKKPMAPILG